MLTYASRQLSLGIRDKVAYTPDNFYPHEGVSSAGNQLLAEMSAGGRTVFAYVYGGPRSGKTHFALRLSKELQDRNRIPRLLVGGDLKRWIESTCLTGKLDPREVIIVDEAESHFRLSPPGESGPTVAMFEKARAGGWSIVFVSGLTPEELPCDDHIMSRIRASHMLQIFAPPDEEMPAVIQMMGRQRGLKLGPSRVSFIARRVGRDVAAVELYLDRVLHLARVLGRPAGAFPVLQDAV